MDINIMKLPRLPAELWPLILDSMYYINCPLDKFKEIELMLRVGSKYIKCAKNCIDVLENGYLLFINQLTSNFLYYLENKLKETLPSNTCKEILEISFINNNILLEIIYYYECKYYDIEVIIFMSDRFIDIKLKSLDNFISFRYEIYINNIIYIIEEQWKTNSKQHRIGGPALTMWWFIDRHNYTKLNTVQLRNNNIQMMSWYKNGNYHRLDGPARLGWYNSKYGDCNILHYEEWYRENIFYRPKGNPKIWYYKNGTINECIE